MSNLQKSIALAASKAARRKRYKVAATYRNNEPTVHGVYDTWDKSQGFNGRLVSEHETRENAQTDADALNAEGSK